MQCVNHGRNIVAHDYSYEYDIIMGIGCPGGGCLFLEIV